MYDRARVVTYSKYARNLTICLYASREGGVRALCPMLLHSPSRISKEKASDVDQLFYIIELCMAPIIINNCICIDVYLIN